MFHWAGIGKANTIVLDSHECGAPNGCLPNRSPMADVVPVGQLGNAIGKHPYPYRVRARFGGKQGNVGLDQLRTVDHTRLRKHLGSVTPATLRSVLHALAELFEI